VTIALPFVSAAEQATEEPSLGFCRAGSGQQSNHSGLSLTPFLVRLIEATAKIIDCAVPIAQLFQGSIKTSLQHIGIRSVTGVSIAVAYRFRWCLGYWCG